MMAAGQTGVARRRVFYIPGYDPYPPRRYRELYRSESQRQAEISGFRIAQKSDPGETGWSVRAEIEGAEVKARIDVLIWNDLVRHSMRGGIAFTYLALLRTAWIYLSTGTLRRLSWLAKGPVLAALYPVAMLLLQALVALLVAAFIGRFVSELVQGALAWIGQTLGFAVAPGAGAVGLAGTLLFWAIFLAVTYFILRWCRAQDDKTFAYYLMQDYAYTASKRGAYPADIEARLTEFRHRIENALQEDIDEVLIVGHSSGAHLAVSLLSDVQRARGAGAEGPALSLLTLGQVIPMVSFLPKATRLRSDLRFLSTCKDITWLDVSAPGDGCCFALSEPVAVSGVAPERGQLWPIVISAAFSNTLSPENLAKLKRRYFRLHFQYLCAFDRPGDYDYYRVTAGPQTLRARFKGRGSSRSRIDVPASRYTSVRTAQT